MSAIRKPLQSRLGEWVRVEFRFERYGKAIGGRGKYKTLLAKDVRLISGKNLLTNHLWMAMGTSLARLPLAPGDHVRMTALVQRYEGGSVGHNYGLYYPKAVLKIPK